MSGAITKIRFSTLEEALVVRGLLDANGIEAWVGNRHHISSDRLSTPALGGVTLLVPTALLPEAHEAIESAERADPALQDKSAYEYSSPRWRVWLGIVILFGTPNIVFGWWGVVFAPSHYVSDSLRLPWWMIPRPPVESNDIFFQSAQSVSVTGPASIGAAFVMLGAMATLIFVDVFEAITGKSWPWRDTSKTERMFDL